MPMVTKGLPISPWFTPWDLLSRCKFSTLTIRQLMVEFYLRFKEILSASKRPDRKRKTAFFDLDFSIRKKSYLMRSNFGDFRAAFFDLAFSIATSYRNGGDFRSEKWRSNNTARLDTKACARPTNKNQEKTSEIRNTHTHQSTKAQTTKKIHKSIRRHDS